MIACPSCGAENPDHANFCNLCHSMVGFDSMDYEAPPASNDGYQSQYPSSFGPDAPAYSPDSFTQMPEAPPVDMGQYGASSGQQWQQAEQQGYYQQPAAPPVEMGQYGAQSGMAPGEPAPFDQGYYGYQPYTAPVHMFSWRRGLLTCLRWALIAAGVSIGLELIFSFMGMNAASQGQFTMAYVWILASLLIPTVMAGFFPGYEMQEQGWILGLISVSGWFFIFRPLYYAILAWMLSGRFAISSLFSGQVLAFAFGLFLPLGALAGWLGQKRSTTGLSF